MQLDDINIFDSKPPTPEEILAAGPGTTATPIDPFERMSAFDRLSTDPVKRNLQKVGRGLGSLFAVETPLDAVLAGVAPAKPVVAAGKGIAAIAKQAEPKDLVFVHNTSEEAIKSFDAMGGIPSPSIAVTKGDQSFTGFGKIQLIGKPEKFDPLIDPRNKIYSADAYTPRAPKKIRLAKDNAAKNFEEDYEHFISMIEKGYFETDLGRAVNQTFFERNVKNVYDRAIDSLENLNKTRGTGILENKYENFDEFLGSSLAKRKFAYEKKLGDEIFDEYDGFKDFSVNQDFLKWKAKERDKYLSQDGVFQYFDDAKETMVTKPYTLENAVNSMIKETQRGGESASTAFGPGSMRALMSREFADLPDIKSESARISSATTSSGGLGSEIGSLLDKYNFPQEITNTRVIGSNMLNDIGIGLSDGKKFDKDLLKDAYNQNIDFDDVQKYTSTGNFEYGQPPMGFLDDLEKIFVENATGNVRYFEAKPTRAVGFDEFAGAIVPDDTSKEVINILEKRGLKVLKETDDDIENMAFDAGEMATNLRQKHFKEQFFSMAPIAAGASATAMMEEEDRGIGSL